MYLSHFAQARPAERAALLLDTDVVLFIKAAKSNSDRPASLNLTSLLHGMGAMFLYKAAWFNSTNAELKSLHAWSYNEAVVLIGLVLELFKQVAWLFSKDGKLFSIRRYLVG